MGGIELVIPSQIGFATVFLGVWLCGWTFGEVFATREVSSVRRARNPRAARDRNSHERHE